MPEISFASTSGYVNSVPFPANVSYDFVMLAIDQQSTKAWLIYWSWYESKLGATKSHISILLFSFTCKATVHAQFQEVHGRERWQDHTWQTFLHRSLTTSSGYLTRAVHLLARHLSLPPTKHTRHAPLSVYWLSTSPANTLNRNVVRPTAQLNGRPSRNTFRFLPKLPEGRCGL